MILIDLPNGEAIFLDANILVYHIGPDPILGPPSKALIHRVETQQISGYTSTAVLSEVAHKLMIHEAGAMFGWSSKIAQRLRQDPSAVRQLVRFHDAIAKIPQLGIRILTIPDAMIETAAMCSRQTGFLSNDALIVAVMQQNGLTNLASHDADFDRVSGLTRYAPA